MRKWYNQPLAAILAATLIAPVITPAGVHAEESQAVRQTQNESVVTVGEASYNSLAEAVVAAQSGATIVLHQDVEIADIITVNKNLTIQSADEAVFTIRRASGYTGALFQLSGSADLKFGASDGSKAVIIDGGASWKKKVTENNEEVEKDASGPNEEGAYNAGATATTALVRVLDQSTLTIYENTVLQNNKITGAGGAAIWVDTAGARIHIYGILRNNEAAHGGGAISSKATLTVYQSAVFSGNKAGENGGAIENHNGGVMQITGARFEGNAAGNRGGALWIDGKTEVTSVTVTGNKAENGGGIFFQGGQEKRYLVLKNGTTVTDNTASQGKDVFQNGEYLQVQGKLSIGDFWVPSNASIAATGQPTGTIGITIPNDEQDMVQVAKGSGYSLKDEDKAVFSSNMAVYESTFRTGEGIRFTYRPLVIDTQPESKKVELNSEATLSVEASHLGGEEEIRYQWYKSSEAGSKGTAIENANEKTVAIDTSQRGVFYYQCELQAAKAAVTVSEAAVVKVIDETTAETPVIMEQPSDGVFDLQKEVTLRTEAEVEDGGALSYQWYRSSDEDLQDPVLLEGATEATYTFTVSESGTSYYFCTITNTKEGLEHPVSSVNTRGARITVNEAAVRYNGTAYTSLDDVLSKIKGGTLEVFSDVTLNKTIQLDADEQLLIKGVPNEEGVVPTITFARTLNAEGFRVNEGGALITQQITLDGGAKWTGNYNKYLQRNTGNSGRETGSSPMITMNGGTVTIGKDSILQNNVTSWATAGVALSRGTLRIEGAILRDFYGGSHGGFLYSNSAQNEITITDTEIYGIQARTSSGALCADTGTKMTISGSNIHHNYTTGRAGAIFVNGTLNITGDTDIHDNYAGSNGGGVIHLSGTMTLEDGMIRNNISGDKGGAIASLGGTLHLKGGTVEGNQANTGKGIYIESSVQVGSELNLDGMKDDIYSPATLKLTLDQNDDEHTETKTVNYFGKYDLPSPQRNGYAFLGWFTDKEGGEKVESGNWITKKSNHTLYAQWELTATDEIAITAQPKGGVFYIEDQEKISVEAAFGGEVSYQWFQYDDENGSGKKEVENATSTEMSLPNEMGTYYFGCILSGENSVDVKSDIIRADMISKNQAYTPVFSVHPENKDIYENTEITLQAAADTIDDGTITYQWYRNKTGQADPEQDKKLEGEEGTELRVQPSKAGTYYYYAVATNTITDESGKNVSSSAVSGLAKVVVHARIIVEDITSSDIQMSSSYWDKYRIGTAASVDGYVKSVNAIGGTYGSNHWQRAFDSNINTFWETATWGSKQALELSFGKEVSIDRILYVMRQDQWKGYPLKFTIYAKSGDEAYREVGVGESAETRNYRMFKLPETVKADTLKFEFTQGSNSWATAAEFVLLRPEDEVLAGSASISGTAAEGETLTVKPDLTVGPEQTGDLVYQWQSSSNGTDFADIEGATEKDYTIRKEDADKYIRAIVRDGQGNFYGSVVSDLYKGTFEVDIDGTSSVGSTVSAKTIYVTGKETFFYQWERSSDGEEFTEITDAVEKDYKIKRKDANKFLRVGVKIGENGTVIYSEAIEVSVNAILTGTPQVGSTIKASMQGVDDEGGFSYQWQIAPASADDSEMPDTSAFTDMDGQTKDSYTVEEGDLGRFIRVRMMMDGQEEEYYSEAWKIQPAGTYLEYKSDKIYISDLRDKDVLQKTVGFKDYMKDKNTSGGTITLLVDGSKNYFMKGIGAHAPATLEYAVSDYVKYYHYDRFVAYLGLDSAQGSNGNGVRFTVQTSKDRQTWDTPVQTGVLKGDTNAVKVDVDISEADYLRISIDSNGNSASDHSVVADAVLANQDYTGEVSMDGLFQEVKDYDEWLKNYENEHPDQTASEMMRDEQYRLMLNQRSFVKAIGYNALKAMLYDQKYIDTLTWFLNDIEAMDLYLSGGKPDGSYLNFVEVLTRLYQSHGEDVSDSVNGTLYKKMMISISFTHSASVTFWADSTQKSDPVRRYEIYKKLYNNGRLITDMFESLEVSEMRWVMNNIIDDEEIEWLNYYVRYHTKFGSNSSNIQSGNLPGGYYFITYRFGYNYNLPKYYSAENKAAWQKKYKLTEEYATEEGIDDYRLNVTYAQGHPKLWIVWEEGAVCGGISKTSSNVLAAFGVPSAVVGQPGHAAYLQFGLTSSQEGTWNIGNDISSWPQSERGEDLLLGWGKKSWSSYYSVCYTLLAQAALNEPDKLYEANRLVKLAEVYSDDPAKREELYKEALGIQAINLDAWEGLIQTYKEQKKNEDEFVRLAGEISEKLVYYPLPMRDLLENLIKPNLTSVTALASLTIYEEASLRKAQKATQSQTLQPSATQRMANHLLGNNNFTLATFSFDGNNAGKIILNEVYSGQSNLQYSLDGGVIWKSAGTVKEHQLTKEELEQITPEKDLLVKLEGTSNYYTIDITSSNAPSGLYVNDRENKLIGGADKLEWKEEGASEWTKIDSKTTFEGDKTVQVRKAANATSVASSTVEYTFTKDTDTKDRKYIPLSRITYVGCSSEEVNKGGSARNALDGNINTMWHTSWAGGDNQRFISISFDEPLYLTSVDYTPRQSESNGIFQKCDIYTSMDGKQWTLSGSASGWQVNAQRKTVNLFSPVYTKYVKVVGAQAVGNFGSAAMLEFFEDTTVEDKAVESVSLKSEPEKKEYVVGDELDLTGLAIEAHYTDGTSSIINNQLFDYSTTVFDQEGPVTITVSYRMNPEINQVSFDVNVSENTKTADRIEIAQIPEKLRYFQGDRIEEKGLVVKAHYTDGSTGHLFADQYTISPETLNEAGTEVPVTVTYLQGDQTFEAQFHVEVTKPVAGIEVTKDQGKIQYGLGEKLDTEGLEISQVYEDGTKEVISESDYIIKSEGFSNTSGTKKVTIVYARKPELTAQMTVVVLPYITDGYLQLESDEGATTAGIVNTTGTLPENGVIDIPSVVHADEKLEFTVTAIRENAFSGNNEITMVTLPETIRSIGANAFRNCNGIKEIYMISWGEEELNALEVSDDAFSSEGEIIEGTIYVATQELADLLKERNLKGLEHFTIRSIDEKITSIRITALDKKEYHLGEAFDASGLKVEATLSDETTMELTDNLYSIISKFSSEFAGIQMLTVQLNGSDKTDSMELTVAPAKPVIDSISEGAVYDTSETAEPLKVTATVSDAGTLSYQWYFTESQDGTPEKIEGETSDILYPNQGQTGYYQVKVTNNDANGNSDTAVSVKSDLIKIEFGDYVARIGNKAYETLNEAVENSNSGDTVYLIKDADLQQNITINKNLVLEGKGNTLKRTEASKNGAMITLSGAKVKIHQMTIDGGAVWTGNVNDILNRGTSNSGIAANGAIVRIMGGELELLDGTSLQNNVNQKEYAEAGGAVCAEDGSTLKLNGGKIINNHTSKYGGAVIAFHSASVVLTNGQVAGNSAGTSGAAFCMDHNSTITMKAAEGETEGAVIENNRTSGSGSAIWLANGKAELQGGTIRNNYAVNDGSAVFMSGNGTVNLGSTYVVSNRSAIRVANGTLNLTGPIRMNDMISLARGKMVNIKTSSYGTETSKIPVWIEGYTSAGAKFANADTKEQAQAATEVLYISNGTLPVYSVGTEVFYGNPTTIQITKNLPEEHTIMTGKELILTVEAEISPEEAGNLVYTWYQAQDKEGNGAVVIAENQGAQGNILKLGDCSEGECYFYCEISVDNGKADSVRTNVTKVIVEKFVPAKKAIEKFTAIK